MSYQGPFEKKECRTCEYAKHFKSLLYCNHPSFFGNARSLVKLPDEKLKNCGKKGVKK